jgi:hypothetical protein
MKESYLPRYDLAAAALYNRADKHHDKLTAQAKREVLAMYRLGQHVEMGRFAQARKVLQAHKGWMDIPTSVWNILYPRD